MTTAATRSAPTGPAALKRRGRFRFGDALLYGVTLAAGLDGRGPARPHHLEGVRGREALLRHLRPRLRHRDDLEPGHLTFGAGTFIFGTALTSFFALLVAGPIAIAIALFLTELAPGWIRAPVGALVEMLASVPSVVLGLWGILVMGPWVVSTLSPILSTLLGWTPFFDGEQTRRLEPARRPS